MTADEREQKLAHLDHCKQAAECAYDEMYEAGSEEEARWQFEVATESLCDAIDVAQELDMTDEVEALMERLAHIRRLFRSQLAS